MRILCILGLLTSGCGVPAPDYTAYQKQILNVAQKYICESLGQCGAELDTVSVKFEPTATTLNGQPVAGRYSISSRTIYVSTEGVSLLYQCSTVLHEYTHAYGAIVLDDVDAGHERLDFDSTTLYNYCVEKGIQ